MATAEFRVIPLGVGGAFTARHFTTCLALGSGDAWMLIECPHPIRRMLHDGTHAAGLPLDLDRVRGVALSHLHADHASGLEDYGFYSYYVLRRRARVLAHPAVAARLWEGLLAGGMGEATNDPALPPVRKQLDEFFELTPLDESAAVHLGPFAVECRRTRHTVPTTAFRVTAGGRTLGFSADTVYDPSLLAWLEPCDLIVHEATTSPESAAVHTHFDLLAALPEALRAKMRLIHYPDDFGDEPRAIEPLREGRCYSV